MKIAHLTTVDISLRYLVMPQLLAAADQGEAIGISAPGPYVPELEAAGIRHVPLLSSTRGMAPLKDLKAALELRRILKNEKVDILHTHNPKPGLYGRIVGRLSGVPIVVNTVHGLYASPDSTFLKRAVVYTAEFVASRFSDAELIQSPEDLELMNAKRISPRSRTSLLGNGVDLTRFDADARSSRRSKAREEMGVEDKQVVVGFVGRLVEEKGILELIEAASRLQESLVFVVVGPDDPEKDDALSSATLTRAHDAGVKLMGMRRDVELLYAGFDLFVLPSHREGFPRAAMEAAASGLPVIATDIRGCRQVVEDGVNGFLFPLGDVDSLVERIDRLGSSQELRAEMGSASIAKARREFDENVVVERVMDCYKAISAEKGLAWQWAPAGDQIAVREATVADAEAVGRMHQQLIGTGFLSSLGPRFLRVLYEAMIDHQESVVVVVSQDDAVVGYISGTSSTGRFYRYFIRNRLFKAAWAMFPSLLRPSVWVKTWETFRHGSDEGGPEAELLSMAVSPVAQGRGVGSRLIEDLKSWASRLDVHEMKVVVGSDNAAAISVYKRNGFTSERTINVHGSDPSLELTWTG